MSMDINEMDFFLEGKIIEKADIQTVEDETEELEIYQKARKFDNLNLIAGSTLNEPLEDFVKREYGKEGLMRLRLARHIFKSLGYRESPDMMLMLACTSPAKVVIATAGAGKTTSLHFDIIITKLIDMALGRNLLKPYVLEGTVVEFSRVLYLNYNKHNVSPIYRKHSEMCSKVQSLIKEDLKEDIQSDTVHALCRKRLVAAKADDRCKTKLPDLNIMSDNDKKEIWESIVVPRWSKYYPDVETPAEVELLSLYETLDSMYNYKEESMLSWESFYDSAKFRNENLNFDFVKACIKKYSSIKNSMGLLDFIDYIILFIKVLKENPEIKEDIQNQFRLIIADENQDFTPLMNELLLQLYNPKLNKLIVVGDPDQTIYSFKGVNPASVVDLIANLEQVTTLGLNTNYRCPNNIIDAAKKILDLNILRFKKPLNGIKTGGKIIKVPVDSPQGQVLSTLKIIEKIEPSDYKDTVITYRNNISSIIIGEELYYAGIPFKVIDANRPFSNKYFRHVFNALLALKKQNNYDLNKELFRFLPIKQSDWELILNANSDRRILNIQDIVVTPKLEQPFRLLQNIAKKVSTESCASYCDDLIEAYKKYHFNYMRKRAGDTLEGQMLDIIESRIKIFFNRNHTFDYIQEEMIERNKDNENGITLSTFHALKGLEFKNVIAIDFQNDIFPNWEGLELKLPKNTALEEKESENRLAYVLVTRTIENIYLVYDEVCPSVYVSILCESDTKNEQFINNNEIDSEILSLASISTSSKSWNSKVDFITRMTGGLPR